MKTIVVIDDSVFCHQMHNLVENLDIPEEHYLGFIKAQLVYLHSLDWLPEKPKDFITISVQDSKPYWRSDYLKRPEVVCKVPRRLIKDRAKCDVLEKLLELLPEEKGVASWHEMNDRKDRLAEELAIHYKGGRKFPEYSFTKLKKTIHHITKTVGWNYLRVTGFEADDLAASVVKLAGTEYNIILLTIDTDWMGLINANTSWYCMHGWYPRSRDITNFNVWVEKRLGVSFNEPRELWDYKAANGDKSDNLPKGSPIEVIDLLAPPKEYCLWKDAEYVSMVQTMLKTQQVPQPSSTGAVLYLQKLGIPVAVKG